MAAAGREAGCGGRENNANRYILLLRVMEIFWNYTVMMIALVNHQKPLWAEEKTHWLMHFKRRWIRYVNYRSAAKEKRPLGSCPSPLTLSFPGMHLKACGAAAIL